MVRGHTEVGGQGEQHCDIPLFSPTTGKNMSINSDICTKNKLFCSLVLAYGVLVVWLGHHTGSAAEEN